MADPLSSFIEYIRSSRKYRSLDLPESLLRDLFGREISAGRSPKEAEKLARQKLHNIVAPYLGDPDYFQAAVELERAFSSGDDAQQKQACLSLLSAHASTRERIPCMEEFYSSILSVTGKPDSIQDLACGLNPLAFPWMGLPRTTRYAAFDIHRPRVELINRFFQWEGMEPLAEARDVLVEPPRQPAHMAFFFKEAHRFEQRQHGCNRAFWQALRVKWLVVTLPAVSLGQRHNMTDRQRRLVYGIVEEFGWPVVELEVGGELIFCIERDNETQE